jgi:DNA polymerase-1
MQQPSSKGYLQCLQADPGHVLVEMDLDAAEQVVLAELSQDPTLLKLYGPGAKPQDVYLFNAAHTQVYSARVREFYDPENPTPEMIDTAKAKLKSLRKVVKIVTLAKAYGAGVNKLFQTLKMAGEKVTRTEVATIHEDLTALYIGTAKYARNLENEWRRNKGWVLNGLGRPLAVADNLTRDLTNRVVQSSTHDILMMILSHLSDLRDESGIKFYGFIWDLHDQIIVNAPEDRAQEVAALFVEALARTNKELAGTIPIKGSPNIGLTLADFKG